MAKPTNITTKIFLDGGDPKETKEIIELLGFIDGQTTNPTLIARNPQAQARLAAGNKFSKSEVYDFYKGIVQELRAMLPGKSVSIEVYGDVTTPTEAMVQQGREMNSWIPDAHIKLPTTNAGLEAASILTSEGVRVNMTLIFTQEQAAAVYSATAGKGLQRGDVFVSPFEGRLDDIEQDGSDIVTNIGKMYESSDHHAEVLMASVRDLNHFLYALTSGVDIITVPGKILREWHEGGMQVPEVDAMTHELLHGDKALLHTPYEQIALDKPYAEYDITHPLTDKGLAKFAADWNNLIEG